MDVHKAFIHLASSVYKTLVISLTRTERGIFDSKKLYNLQVGALETVQPALKRCRDANKQKEVIIIK